MKNIILIKQIDKANHIIVGGLIYCVLSCFMADILALLIVVGVSAAKEWYDVKRYRMIFDWMDFAATIVGALPIFIKDLI